LKWLLAGVILVLVLVIYRLVSAPTASFWDCGELIACCYILGIPHPPGTPLFVMLGRLFSFLPVNPEPASRIGFLTSFFGAMTCMLLYLLIVKITTMYIIRRPSFAPQGTDRKPQGPNPEPRVPNLERPVAAQPRPQAANYSYLPYIAGVIGAMSLAFAFSFWDNSVETEVYGPVTSAAVLVLLLALNWREKVEQAISDNRVVLASIFLVLLSAGIHFTPMLVVFALLVFWLVVERRSVLDLRLFEFVGGFLIILTIDSMIKAGAGPAGWLLVSALLAGLLALAVWIMERSRRAVTVIYGLLALGAMFAVAYVAGFDARTGKDLIVDDLVLFLASPVSALVERWLAGKALFIIFAVAYLGYLYWLARKKRLDAGYVGLGLFLILLAGTIQYILMVRAAQHPGINEADPETWDAFISVLKREQYDPMKLYPRKTMFASESDYLGNVNAKLGLLAGYFEQIKFYLRYFFWQWAGKENLDVLAYSKNWFWPFLRLNPLPALVGLLIPALGVWGIVDQYRRDRRSFTLIGLAFLVSSLGLLTYLNLKLSPSDPRHLYTDAARGEGMHFVEVRERDYFYAFSYVFYAAFIGLGAFAFLAWARARLRNRQGWFRALVAGTVAFSLLPMAFNWQEVTRAGDWIPAEYGYDMVASCDDGSVVFTNGDNDTFPLWFVQQVPTRIAGDPKGFRKPEPRGKGVAVANLSLLNTDWFVRQLIDWGAPLSFDQAKFDSIPQEAYYGAQERMVLIRDMVIRDMIATNSGIQLRWGNEHQRVLDPRTNRPVMVLAFRDEYQEARTQYNVLMKGVLDSTRGRAQGFLAASDEFLRWLDANRFSIAAIELRSRRPKYEELRRQGAGPDSLAREKKSFEKWLQRGDYGMSSAEFVKYVLPNYKGKRPIYFATTVQDEYMRDVTKGDSVYVEIEGLVQRVVPRAGPLAARERRINPARSRHLLEDVYVTSSMCDPRVQKDQNSRGMFGNFILAYLKLAEMLYAESLQFDRAKAVIGKGLALDTDPSRKLALYEAMTRYSYLSGDYKTSLEFLDSLQRHVDDPPTLQHLVILRSFVSQLSGDFATATSLISNITSHVPVRNVTVVFDTIYAMYARVRGFDHPRQVLARWHQYNPRDSMPVWIGASLDEIERGTGRGGLAHPADGADRRR
jgi:hypothetical protein